MSKMLIHNKNLLKMQETIHDSGIVRCLNEILAVVEKTVKFFCII
jgi:hypothetical protein